MRLFYDRDKVFCIQVSALTNGQYLTVFEIPQSFTTVAAAIECVLDIEFNMTTVGKCECG